MRGPVRGGSYDGGMISTGWREVKLYHADADINPNMFGHIVETYKWVRNEWVFVGSTNESLDHLIP